MGRGEKVRGVQRRIAGQFLSWIVETEVHFADLDRDEQEELLDRYFDEWSRREADQGPKGPEAAAHPQT